ncbi:MAG: hypothetical protein Q8Q09_04545 [Deltaproteobacteria bacterium]|nr:hypothetical protein [Deltaproteobacteria bacterium]
MSNEAKALSALLEANHKLNVARSDFQENGSTDAKIKAITAAIEQAFAAGDSTDAGLSLILMTDVLVEVQSPVAAKLLLRVLGHTDPGIRVSAGEALVELLAENWNDGAKAIESYIATDGASLDALRELPFVLAEVAEPAGAELIAKLLAHKDADVAASAIEALVELGNDEHMDAMRALVSDKRELSVEEDDDSGVAGGTLGELANDALEVLSTLAR